MYSFIVRIYPNNAIMADNSAEDRNTCVFLPKQLEKLQVEIETTVAPVLDSPCAMNNLALLYGHPFYLHPTTRFRPF